MHAVSVGTMTHRAAHDTQRTPHATHHTPHTTKHTTLKVHLGKGEGGRGKGRASLA